MNTDGILCIVPHSKKEAYLKVCEDISKAVKVDVEYTYYKQYIRKDVNNYISILKDSPNNVTYEDLLKNEFLKQKGRYFLTKIQLSKGYYYPIIAKALNKYYVEGVDIETTIKSETDLYLFICSQKVDTSKYLPELHYYDDNWNLCKDKLQKINRWIVTTTGKKFFKSELDDAKVNRLHNKELKNKKITVKDKQNKQIGVEIDHFITIVNKITDDNALNYNINYDFYISLCNDIINMIDPPIKQLSLF